MHYVLVVLMAILGARVILGMLMLIVGMFLDAW